MRPLSRARHMAMTIRARTLPPIAGSIVGWVRDELRLAAGDQWSIEQDVTLLADAVLDGPQRAICYHPRIVDDMAKFRRVLAHELGHFVLHPRLRSSDPDSLGEFASEDLARRTSRFDWEEADAESFAYELLCPASEVFACWRSDSNTCVDTLAARFGVSRDIVGVQLSRALADVCDGQPAESRLPACTAAQLAAAHTLDAATYLDAGPGTGKTRSLIERVRWLVEEHCAKAEKILVLSFSNAAVGTVRERLLSQNEEWGGRVTVSTVHSLASEIVRCHRGELGYERLPSVLDEAGQIRRVRELLQAEAWPGLLDPFQVAESIKRLRDALRKRSVSRARARWFAMEGVDETHPTTDLIHSTELHRFEFELAERRKATHEVTFDELVDLANKSLSDARQATRWRERYRYLVIDEAQDLSPAQLHLILTLAPPDQPAWFAGDHRQRIFGFQGADPNILSWIRRFYGMRLQEVVLKENHRTNPAGVEPLNDIAQSVDPDQGTRWQSTRVSRDDGLPTGSAKFEVSNKNEGVATVVRLAIAALAKAANHRSVVVLTRHNIDASVVVRTARRHGVKAFVPGGLEIDGVAGDIAAMLDPGLVGPIASQVRAAIAEDRVGHRPAANTVARIREIVKTIPPEAENSADKEAEIRADSSDDFAFSALIRFLFDDGGYLRDLLANSEPIADGRVAQIATILLMARGLHGRSGPNLHRRHLAQLILAHCTGAPPQDACRGSGIDAVRVMTIHQAKGREFEHVIALLTAPKHADSGETSDHPWTPVACEAFVAASRGTRRTEFVLVGTPSRNPFAMPLTPITSEALSSTPAFVETTAMSFAASSLWSPDVRLGVDGGFWRDDWCAMTAFVRSTLRVRPPSRDERLEVDALRLLRQRLSEGLGGNPQGPDVATRFDLPAPWVQRVEQMAADICASLDKESTQDAHSVQPSVCDLGGQRRLIVRLPVVGVRESDDGRADPIILLAPGRVGRSDNRALEGLADAVHYYLNDSTRLPKRVVVVTIGSNEIDEYRGTALLHKLESTRSMSKPRSDKLIALREGTVSAAPNSFGCTHCSARLLCPAYHLPDLADVQPFT